MPSGSSPTADQLILEKTVLRYPSDLSGGELDDETIYCDTVCGAVVEKTSMVLPRGAFLGAEWTESVDPEECCPDKILTECCSRRLSTTLAVAYHGSGDCSCLTSGDMDIVYDDVNGWWGGDIDASGCGSSTINVRFYCDGGVWKLRVSCENDIAGSSQVLEAFSSQDCDEYSLSESFVTSAPFIPCCTTGTMTFTVTDPGMADGGTIQRVSVTKRRIYLPPNSSIVSVQCRKSNDLCCSLDVYNCVCSPELGITDFVAAPYTYTDAKRILYVTLANFSPAMPYLEGKSFPIVIATVEDWYDAFQSGDSCVYLPYTADGPCKNYGDVTYMPASDDTFDISITGGLCQSFTSTCKLLFYFDTPVPCTWPTTPCYPNLGKRFETYPETIDGELVVKWNGRIGLDLCIINEPEGPHTKCLPMMCVTGNATKTAGFPDGIILGQSTNHFGPGSNQDAYRDIVVTQVDCDPYVAIGVGGFANIGWYNIEDIGLGDTCLDHIQALPGCDGTEFTFDIFITE